MKIEIKDTHNGWIVTYDKEDQYGENQYVYKSTEDLIMLEEITKRFLKRQVKIEEK
jgi:hypothetical protein